MRLVQSDKDFLDQWEALISTVDKTDIPIRFVRDINLEFHTPVDGVEEQIINIAELRDHGFDENGLDEIVEAVFKEHNNNLKAVHFYLDVEHVADVAQQHTNIFLENI